MEYNLATLRRDLALDLLDDEEYDPAILDRAISRAQREIFNQFELSFMEKIFSGDIPEGSTMIKYPEDMSMTQSHTLTAPDGTLYQDWGPVAHAALYIAVKRRHYCQEQ